MKILIDSKEYSTLVKDSLMLECLENAGVDNWDNYNYAYKEFNESLEELNNIIDSKLHGTA